MRDELVLMQREEVVQSAAQEQKQWRSGGRRRVSGAACAQVLHELIMSCRAPSGGGEGAKCACD